MGFFGLAQKADTSLPKGLSLAFLHKHGCQVCPLYKLPGNRNPDMAPTGSDHPVIYMLGEAPGAEEDRKAEQFIGKAGRALRFRIPDKWKDKLRWNNTVRTRPPDNRDPTKTEIECCRPSIIHDVEETKPIAIFGFGNVPLNWALNESGITRWTGRKIPVKIGTHTCWYFPLVHPSAIIRGRKFEPRSPRDYGSDQEFVFARHLQQAFDQVEAGLPDPEVHSKEDILSNIVYVDGHNRGDLDLVLEHIDDMWDEKEVGYDYETKGTRPYASTAKILTVALSGQKRTMAFAIDHKGAGWSEDDRKEIKKHLKTFLRKAPCRKIAHHLPFELEWSAFFFGREVVWGSKWGCSLAQAYVIDAKPHSHSLEFLCLQYFGVNIKDLTKLDKNRLDDEPLDKVLLYNGADARYHRLLYQAQSKELTRLGLQDIYRIQLKRAPTMVLTQMKGVPIDQAVVNEFEEKYTRRRNRVEAELKTLSCIKKFKQLKGYDFNPASNRDVPFLITQILKIPLEGGADEEALEKVKDPFAKLLVRWRKANKQLSTYVLSVKDGYEKTNIFPDHLLHPIMNGTRTKTWRTSSDSPNIQNWPKRGPGKVVRRQVRPGSDYVVVALDYAGIQARNVAMESKDKKLVDAYWHHYDIHTDFTERLIKIYPRWIDEGVTALKDKTIFKAYRNRVKNEFVFPSFFGAIPSSVAGYLAVPEFVGEKLQEQFWDDFRDVPKWHEEIAKQYMRHGYISGLSGFRHYAPIELTERVNYPIQADESLIVCNAMTRLSQYDDGRLQPNMMIHDDLTFVMHKKEVDKLTPIILKEMLYIEYDWVNVPLAVEMSIGTDWYSLEAVGEYESLPDGGYKQVG